MAVFIIAYCEEGGEGEGCFLWSGHVMSCALVLIFSYSYAKVCPSQ